MAISEVLSHQHLFFHILASLIVFNVYDLVVPVVCKNNKHALLNCQKFNEHTVKELFILCSKSIMYLE